VPNAVTVRPGEVAGFAASPLPHADLFVVLSALAPPRAAAGTVVATLVLHATDGRRREYPLALDEDLFRFGGTSWRQPRDGAAVYAGVADDPDVLIWTRLPALALSGGAERVELRAESESTTVTLLAATLVERDGVRSGRAAERRVPRRLRER
jgi:hypothetical protein